MTDRQEAYRNPGRILIEIESRSFLKKTGIVCRLQITESKMEGDKLVCITGDTHQDIDVHKLTTNRFPEQKSMTKGDIVIIAGDFGCIWDGSKSDRYWLNWYKDKPFTTVFIDGNHENFRLLNSYPIVQKFGGNVHRINDSVFHLMRGEVYEINQKRYFCMGGASSHDKHLRKQDVSWWKEELPSKEEYENAIRNLDRVSWNVDYIVTHCAPKSIQKEIAYWYENDELTGFLQLIEKDCRFKHWYFAHYHIDRNIDEKHTALYQKVIPIGQGV